MQASTAIHNVLKGRTLDRLRELHRCDLFRSHCEKRLSAASLLIMLGARRIPRGADDAAGHAARSIR